MVLIVQSLWNQVISERLVEGAQKVLREKGFETDLLKVPGALEIPLAIKWAWAEAQRKVQPFYGVVGCGSIIRGDTYHFEIVANESARALMQLSLELRIPIGNALLATYTLDQAIERSGSKGQEAAEAVCTMLAIQKERTY